MKSAICIVLALVAVASARPGLYYTYPAASSDTSVVRDALGNQQTSYAYQDGHSSAVAVTRNDVSKHLVYHQPAQVVYQAAPVVHAPAAYYTHHAVASPIYTDAAYYV